jgi:NTE family protein
VERLREYWRLAASPEWLPAWQRVSRWTGAIETRLLGRPGLFHPNLPTLLAEPPNPGLFDTTPMRGALTRLIDFARLNDGPVRLSVQATDLESGEPVAFDTRRNRIELDHLLASAALIPDFRPVRVGERWLIDGGMVANVPVGLVLTEPLDQDSSCFVADPFPLRAPRPRDLVAMAARQSDLMFACQTDGALRQLSELYRLRMLAGEVPKVRIDVIRLAYAAHAEETALKSWDFSPGAIDQRWRAGMTDMETALGSIRAAPPRIAGLALHP